MRGVYSATRMIYVVSPDVAFLISLASGFRLAEGEMFNFAFHYSGKFRKSNLFWHFSEVNVPFHNKPESNLASEDCLTCVFGLHPEKLYLEKKKEEKLDSEHVDRLH